MIVAENGTTPGKKSARRLKKQSARMVSLQLAEGWLAEAERLGRVRKSIDDAKAKEDRNKVIKSALTTALNLAKEQEREAWLYVLLFALPLTPKHRTRFKRLAYTHLLAKDKLTRHLTPGLPNELEKDGDLRKAIRKAFSVRMKKKKNPDALPTMPEFPLGYVGFGLHQPFDRMEDML